MAIFQTPSGYSNVPPYPYFCIGGTGQGYALQTTTPQTPYYTFTLHGSTWQEVQYNSSPTATNPCQQQSGTLTQAIYHGSYPTDYYTDSIMLTNAFLIIVIIFSILYHFFFSKITTTFFRKTR